MKLMVKRVRILIELCQKYAHSFQEAKLLEHFGDHPINITFLEIIAKIEVPTITRRNFTKKGWTTVFGLFLRDFDDTKGV